MEQIQDQGRTDILLNSNNVGTTILVDGSTNKTVVEPLLLGDSPEESLTTEAKINEPEPPVQKSIFAKDTEPYKDWICPISFKLMSDPVVAQDGNSYERSEIETWLSKNSTSPMDRTEILDKTLYKNIALKTTIQLWKSNNPNYVKEDEELDRQTVMAALRVKPAAIRPIVRHSPFITHVGTVTIPGWNTIQSMFNDTPSANSQTRFLGNLSPRISQLMRNNSSIHVGILDP
jgi:hypothetical protein